MSGAERDRWNARYRDRGPATRTPSRYLTSLDEVLPRQGRALDIAGGAGRNAVWLAGRGLDVTIVDIAEAGLALAHEEARASGLSVRTVLADLDSEPLPPGPWDVILVFHFLLRPLFGPIIRALAPGGYFVFVHPTRSNLQRHAKPSARYLLEDGELPDLISAIQDPEFELLAHEEGWLDEGRHEARLLARRRAP